MEYYWSEYYGTVFNSAIHKHPPEDCIEITEQEYKDKINELCSE